MTLADIPRKHGIILDTNLMLLYCTGRHDPALIGKFNERLSGYSADDYQLLVKFIGLFKKISTTPNVLTEVVNLIDKKNRLFRGLLQTIHVDLSRVDEQYLPSSTIADVEVRHFQTFGLTDLVLYQMAQANYLILTNDDDLRTFIVGKKYAAINFEQLRDLLIQKRPPRKPPR
jgi:rRNA-processing protein FCF1